MTDRIERIREAWESHVANVDTSTGDAMWDAIAAAEKPCVWKFEKGRGICSTCGLEDIEVRIVHAVNGDNETELQADYCPHCGGKIEEA